MASSSGVGLLRNVDRYITVLGAVRLALAVQIPPIDREQLIRHALQCGKDAQVTREEILEAWDESPAAIVRLGFGEKKPPALKPSTEKQANVRGWYYAIVWRVNDDLTRTRVYKSTGTFSTREAALEEAQERARALVGDPIP